MTNFTSLIDDLNTEEINHVLLITSQYHIKRAKVIGEVIASSRGIRLTSLSIPCKSLCEIKSQRETIKKRNIDLVRSIIWVISGKDFKSWVPPFLKQHFEG